MYREIGSDFWYDTSKIKDLKCDIEFKNIKLLEYEDIAYLWNGRSAIAFTLDNVNCNNEKALLPAYTCHTVIEPFIEKGYEVEYYNLNKNLEINIDDLNNKLLKFKPSIVLFHAYYGFNTLESVNSIVAKLKEENVIIIEDITQSLFSHIKHIDADYYVGSFRKWIAIPDGGFAISVKDKFKNKPLKTNNTLLNLKLKAFHIKNSYMEKNIGEKVDFFKLYRETDKIMDEDKGLYCMSDESKYILNNLNKNKLMIKRRENFEFLLENIKNIDGISPVFNKITSNIVPLYFPIYIKKDRAKLQKYLGESNIYAPVIWPITSMVDNKLDESTANIYDEVLAIPCDQRYGINEMRKISKKILEYKEVK